MPNNLQNTAYLDPGLIDVAPDNVTISTPNISGTNQIGTNIGQVGGGIIGSNIGSVIGGTGVNLPNLSAGELTVSGTPEPKPYEPYEDNYPTQPDETVDKTTTQSPKIKLGNLLKSTSALPKSYITQQQSNLANVLRGTQMPQTMIPSIYKQANPFNFGQQASPVQDVSALAKLLRTA
jgi:hypothetical protein